MTTTQSATHGRRRVYRILSKHGLDSGDTENPIENVNHINFWLIFKPYIELAYRLPGTGTGFTITTKTSNKDLSESLEVIYEILCIPNLHDLFMLTVNTYREKKKRSLVRKFETFGEGDVRKITVHFHQQPKP